MAIAERTGDRSVSQSLKALLALRELVLRGELRPGERVSELQMVERLGVSRTPVRMALVRLEEEGLLDAIPSGGFAVKAFSEREVLEAIEIRGTLEGLAARLAAERGVGRSDLEAAATCLDALDEVVRHDTVEVDISRYVELNAQFHALLIDLTGSPALARQIEQGERLAVRIAECTGAGSVPLSGISSHPDRRSRSAPLCSHCDRTAGGQPGRSHHA